MQRITWKPHTYKRAALLLFVLALRIDSRRDAPTLHTLASVPYSPRIQTPHKESKPQRIRRYNSPGPVQAGRSRFPSCLLSCLLSYMHTTNAANGSTVAGQPQHLTHSPTINRRKARRNASSRFAAWAVSAAAIRANWATFSRFSCQIFADDPGHARRHSCVLACIFMHE